MKWTYNEFYNNEEDDRWDPFSHVGGEIIHFGFLKLIMMHNICFHYLSSISIPIHHLLSRAKMVMKKLERQPSLLLESI